MKGGKDIKCEISYETCEDNFMLITHFVHGLLVYNIHVFGDLADVELFSFIKNWLPLGHAEAHNKAEQIL